MKTGRQDKKVAVLLVAINETLNNLIGEVNTEAEVLKKLQALGFRKAHELRKSFNCILAGVLSICHWRCSLVIT